jgi:uncharacterized protein
MTSHRSSTRPSCKPGSEPGSGRNSRLVRMPWLLLAYGCVGAGAMGVIVPLLPTTPFLLVAAWAAPKGSPKLDRWLHEHPRFGPSIIAWRRERAVPARAKKVAVALLLMSWVVLWAGGMPAVGLVGFGLFFSLVATFILTRPTPSATPPIDTPLQEQVAAHD